MISLPRPIRAARYFGKKGNKYILAVCNAADEKNRDNLTLRLSTNKGKTWYFNKVIAKASGEYEGAYTAYSDIVLVHKNKIGILYEKDNYKTIVFTTEKTKQ